MEEEIILGRDLVGETFKQFLSQYDAPAYMRRARAVEAALQQLHTKVRLQREEWLKMPRTYLGILRALSQEWSTLLPLLEDAEQIGMLQKLDEELKPTLRSRIEPTSSPRTLGRALRELQQSLERFNARWQAFLSQVDLTALNEQREAYNRYYVLEKECAVRSARVARQGFVRLQPITTDDLFLQFPLLPVPQSKN